MAQYLRCLTLAGAAAALVAVIFYWRILMSSPDGSEERIEVSEAVRIGMNAFLRRYNKAALFLVLGVFVVLYSFVFFDYINVFVPWSFLSGAAFSAFAGFVALTATAQMKRVGSLDNGRVTLAGWTAIGFIVVGVALMHLSLWYLFLNNFYSALSETERIGQIAEILLHSSLGATALTFFTRVGGGVYAQTGQLVSKIALNPVKEGLPHPAVVGDLVGEGISGIPSLGLDLYSSYTAATAAACSLAVAAGLGVGGIVVPLALSGVGVFASLFGLLFVRGGEMRRGKVISSIVMAVASLPVLISALGWAHVGLYFPILCGLAGGVVIRWASEFFTSPQSPAARETAATAALGDTAVLGQGLAVGLGSVGPVMLAVAAVAFASFQTAGGAADLNYGLYGMALAVVGMLSTLGSTLSADAGGTTARPVGRNFGLAAAALAAVSLLAAFRGQILAITSELGLELGADLNLLSAQGAGGLVLGGMLPFAFSSLLMLAVNRTAGLMVVLVQDEGADQEGYSLSSFVDASAERALKAALLPALFALASPIVVFYCLGAAGTVGFLSGALLTGLALALFAANAGGSGQRLGTDLVGTSLGILLKLIVIVSIVLARFLMLNHLL